MEFIMCRFIKKIIACAVLFALLISAGCSDKSDSEKDKIIKDLTSPKFLSTSKPGKWEKQAEDHVPDYIIKTDKENKIIKVKVPFNGSIAPLHYVEAIILTDHNHKEIQKETFPRGNKIAETEFFLPLDYRSTVYIVIKCNLHDMWEKKVFLHD